MSRGKGCLVVLENIFFSFTLKDAKFKAKYQKNSKFAKLEKHLHIHQDLEQQQNTIRAEEAADEKSSK